MMDNSQIKDNVEDVLCTLSEYLVMPKLDDGINNAIKDFYLSHGKENTYHHVAAVTKVAIVLAKRFGADQKKCKLAALLHDISVVIDPAKMLVLAHQLNWKLDPAEQKYPFLLHQNISSLIAQKYFEITDEVILSAISHHTTLKADPSKIDMIIFLADKIAWDQPGRPPFQELVEQALDISLENACYSYIKYQFDHHLLLYPHHQIIAAYDSLTYLTKLIIRGFEEKDYKNICSLIHYELGYHAVEYDKLCTHLNLMKNDSNYHVLVATIDNEVVAFIGLVQELAFEIDSKVLRIIALVVKQEYQGRKIGSKLLDQAKLLALNHDIKAMALSSGLLRREAHHFYEKQGFIKKGYSFINLLD